MNVNHSIQSSVTRVQLLAWKSISAKPRRDNETRLISCPTETKTKFFQDLQQVALKELKAVRISTVPSNIHFKNAFLFAI
jgi:hypothetical protein